MKILDLYIGRTLTRHFLLVLFALCFMLSLFEFFDQMDDVGRGAYHYKDAFFFVLFTLPSRILDLIPESMLLGSIIALGLMADNNEFLALRAGGISMWRICWSVLTTAALLVVVAGIIAEFIAPPLDHHARIQRQAALAGKDIIFSNGGFWVNEKPFFIHVRNIRNNGSPSDIDIFEWDQDGRLRVFTYAREADTTKDKEWVLKDIVQKTITDHEISSRSVGALPLKLFMRSEQLAIQEFPPESLSPSDLYQYARVMETRGQNADQYKMVFWQRVTTPFAMFAMILISLTFVFGPTRGTSVGYKIMMGAIVGIALHFINQIFGLIGLYFGVNPAITTMTPIVIILCFALWRLSHSQ
ncbi:MAG: LPS export ABC transporter permease LptG [Desulfosalsimonadaceae bacterium]